MAQELPNLKILLNAKYHIYNGMNISCLLSAKVSRFVTKPPQPSPQPNVSYLQAARIDLILAACLFSGGSSDLFAKTGGKNNQERLKEVVGWQSGGSFSCFKIPYFYKGDSNEYAKVI